MDKKSDSFIVSVSFEHDFDSGVLLVGKQNNGQVEIVNAFQGKEAWDLYQKLVTKKEK